MTGQDDFFTLKDHLLSIISKLDRMEAKLEVKADLVAVQSLELRTAGLERYQAESAVRTEMLVPLFKETRDDVEDLKGLAAGLRAVDTYRKWLLGVGLVAVVNTGIAAAQLWAS
jgi:hypothetical protein